MKTLRESIEEQLMVYIRSYTDGIMHKSMCELVVTDIFDLILKRLPDEKEISEHQYHDLSDGGEYCHTCNKGLSDEEPFGNAHYNQCLKEIKELLK